MEQFEGMIGMDKFSRNDQLQSESKSLVYGEWWTLLFDLVSSKGSSKQEGDLSPDAFTLRFMSQPWWTNI